MAVDAASFGRRRQEREDEERLGGGAAETTLSRRLFLRSHRLTRHAKRRSTPAPQLVNAAHNCARVQSSDIAISILDISVYSSDHDARKGYMNVFIATHWVCLSQTDATAFTMHPMEGARHMSEIATHGGGIARCLIRVGFNSDVWDPPRSVTVLTQTRSTVRCYALSSRSRL